MQACTSLSLAAGHSQRFRRATAALRQDHQCSVDVQPATFDVLFVHRDLIWAVSLCLACARAAAVAAGCIKITANLPQAVHIAHAKLACTINTGQGRSSCNAAAHDVTAAYDDPAWHSHLTASEPLSMSSASLRSCDSQWSLHARLSCVLACRLPWRPWQ